MRLMSLLFCISVIFSTVPVFATPVWQFMNIEHTSCAYPGMRCHVLANVQLQSSTERPIISYAHATLFTSTDGILWSQSLEEVAVSHSVHAYGAIVRLRAPVTFSTGSKTFYRLALTCSFFDDGNVGTEKTIEVAHIVPQDKIVTVSISNTRDAYQRNNEYQQTKPENVGCFGFDIKNSRGMTAMDIGNLRIESTFSASCPVNYTRLCVWRDNGYTVIPSWQFFPETIYVIPKIYGAAFFGHPYDTITLTITDAYREYYSTCGQIYRYPMRLGGVTSRTIKIYPSNTTKSDSTITDEHTEEFQDEIKSYIEPALMPFVFDPMRYFGF